MPELVDLVVDVGLFLDVEVAAGHVGLGLVVVVVGDEVLDGVVGEEVAELLHQLGCQRLVRRDHQGGALDQLDDLGHRVRLAGAGDAQQRLVLQAGANALCQLFDGLRLISARFEVGDDLEGRVVADALADEVHGGIVAHGPMARASNAEAASPMLRPL